MSCSRGSTLVSLLIVQPCGKDGPGLDDFTDNGKREWIRRRAGGSPAAGPPLMFVVGIVGGESATQVLNMRRFCSSIWCIQCVRHEIGLKILHIIRDSLSFRRHERGCSCLMYTYRCHVWEGMTFNSSTFMKGFDFQRGKCQQSVSIMAYLVQDPHRRSSADVR